MRPPGTGSGAAAPGSAACAAGWAAAPASAIETAMIEGRTIPRG